MDTNNNEDAAEFAKKMAQINDIFNDKISSFGLDELRERGKENNMTSLTKYNKPEMRDMLVAEFQRNWDVLKDTKLDDLRVYARENKVVGFSTAKKNELIVLIMTKVASCEERPFAAAGLIKLKQNKTTSGGDVAEPKDDIKKPTTDEKKTTDEDKKIQDDIKKPKDEDKKILDDTKKPKDEDKKIPDDTKKPKDEDKKKAKQDELEKQKQEELERQKEEDKQRNEELKRKKQSIPKSVRTHVWDLYIGSDINKHRCVCCKKTHITITNFDVGHVLSERDGGTLEISNLRPICSVCNHSMGCTNMVDFVKKYGYYIG